MNSLFSLFILIKNISFTAVNFSEFIFCGNFKEPISILWGYFQQQFQSFGFESITIILGPKKFNYSFLRQTRASKILLHFQYSTA